MAKQPTSTLPDLTTTTGNGGETHQQGGGLTTNHGVPISDNQNSLKAGAARPNAARGFRATRKDFPLRP